MTTETYLSVKWSVSRGRDTYGYNICTITDQNTGKRYRCNGGGYDMEGTSFGEWLEATHQTELAAISGRAQTFTDWRDPSALNLGTTRTANPSPDALYGFTFHREPSARPVSLDGACGMSSMRKIAEAIGLELTRTHDRKGNTTGYIVSQKVSVAN
jgi:hypothetical protein